ncbi:MAG: hypothetical protein J6A75_04910 [Lachnospiraceae bacterium]|nr:hypothetical protein [Lachnospiraceae bacterium]
MRIEDVNARKAYIQSVRQSFDNPNRTYEFEYDTNHTKGEAEDSFSFCKVRLLIAVFIFAAYVLCDQTNTSFYQYSTQEVADKIAQNYDYTKIQEEVVQVFHQTMDTEYFSNQ